MSKLIGATPGTCVYDNGHCCETNDRVVTGPDVVLLELDTRNANAEHVLREAREAWTPAPVLVLSESSDSKVNRELVRMGARGVLAKEREWNYLITAIRKVSNGEIWLPRRCLSAIIDEMAAAAHVQPLPDGAFGTLTGREREVIALIAGGLKNRAIAQKLGITETTVRHHLTAVFSKVGVTDRLQLAVHALRH